MYYTFRFVQNNLILVIMYSLISINIILVEMEEKMELLPKIVIGVLAIIFLALVLCPKKGQDWDDSVKNKGEWSKRRGFYIM